MTTNLPAYLQSGQTKKLNEAALLGIGSALPPHISIRGNTFTLVDASGAQQVAGPQLDICVADLSDVVCKQFYSEKWTPDSNDPPLCWSANGVAPSREAIEPQHPTCADCRHNVRGSAVSALSGAAIKACRDEKWLAVLIPQIPQVKFQLRLTPGSFKTWQSFVKLCEGNQTEISDVLTRITFQPGTNGVLLFQAVSYIGEETARLRNAGYAEKAFDVLVGRTDRPIQGALPAPGQAPAALPPATPYPQQPAPFQSAPNVAFGSTSPAMPPPQRPAFPSSAAPASASPSEPPQQRRRRRTQAEIAADNAYAAPAPSGAPVAPFRPQAVAPGQPGGGPAFGAQQEQLPPATNPQFSGGGAPPAFAAAPGQQPAPGAQFGMAPGVPPNPELTAALDGLFAKK